MTNKIALLMFVATVLLASIALVVVPQASALTPAIVKNYDATASRGNSNICGDHVCAPGEQTQWYNAVWQSQKVSQGKIVNATLGEDVIAKMVGFIPVSKTMPGSNMTSSPMNSVPSAMYGNMNMSGSKVKISTMIAGGMAMPGNNMTMPGNATMPASTK